MLRGSDGLPLRERLAAALQAVRDVQTDLASLRGAVLAPQLRALGIDQHTSNLKIHIGCGGHELEGWIDIDNDPAPLAINLDCVVPDIEKCLRAYADKDDAFFDSGCSLRTRPRCLERAGFVQIRRCAHQQSPHEELRVDHASSSASAKHGDEHYSLFVEAQA